MLYKLKTYPYTGPGKQRFVYTWDGSNPTEASEKYQTPLVIPEGNTVLSVLVVDDTYGLKSNIYRTNFIYFPEETEE